MPSLTVVATLNALRQVRAFLHATLDKQGLNMSAVDLAVEELFVNTVRHAYTSRQGDIVVDIFRALHKGTHGWQIRLRDWGTPFDPFAEAPLPDLESGVSERRSGGLGVFLVQKLCPDHTYLYEDSTNTVNLFFPCCPEEG